MSLYSILVTLDGRRCQALPPPLIPLPLSITPSFLFPSLLFSSSYLLFLPHSFDQFPSFPSPFLPPRPIFLPPINVFFPYFSLSHNSLSFFVFHFHLLSFLRVLVFLYFFLIPSYHTFIPFPSHSFSFLSVHFFPSFPPAFSPSLFLQFLFLLSFPPYSTILLSFPFFLFLSILFFPSFLYYSSPSFLYSFLLILVSSYSPLTLV